MFNHSGIEYYFLQSCFNYQKILKTLLQKIFNFYFAPKDVPECKICNEKQHCVFMR